MSQNSKISTYWIQGLNATDKEALINQLNLNADNPVFKEFLELLEKRKKSIEASSTSIESYDNPCWAYYQAHRNGEKQTIKFIEDLLAFVNK